MRGGAHEPLTRADIDDKFILNARYGGWQESRIAPALAEASLMAGRVTIHAESNGALSERSESKGYRLAFHLSDKHLCHSSIPERKRPRSL